jgi:Phosphotransferase enzyme family
MMSEQTGAPIWISKSASGETAARRIRMEYLALDHLAPWADELQIPRVIEWEETANECRLTQTGISGRQDDTGVSTHASGHTLDLKFADVFAWIDKFETVALPRYCTVNALAAEFAGKIENKPAIRSSATELIRLLFELRRVGHMAAVPTHGDLHWRNVLLQHPGVGVIDWATFDSGFPLQNKFSYTVNNVYFEHGRSFRLVENYHHVFFSDSPACKWLLNLVRQMGFSIEEASQLFYCFFANQLCLDAEMPVQTWLDILDFLRENRFPRLGTPLPAPPNHHRLGRQK